MSKLNQVPSPRSSSALVKRTAALLGLVPSLASAAEGPIALWNFEERSGAVAADASGNGHTGTINGAYWHNDFANGAIYCDGSGHVAVDDAPALRLTNAFTIACWIRLADRDGEGSMRMVSKKAPWYADNGYEFEYKPSINELSLVGRGRDRAFALVDLDENWHHLAVTVSGTTAQFFVDGIAIDMLDDQTGAISAGSQVMAIGRHAGG